MAPQAFPGSWNKVIYILPQGKNKAII